MHEATIVKNVVDAVAQHLADEGLSGRVNAVHLRIGRLAAAVPANLRFLFRIFSENTPLEGAVLEIEEVSVKMRCRSCDAEYLVDDRDFGCRSCGSSDAVLTEGREVIVDSVEVVDT
jgi:hydrogenase nickel incorporation protein HypA/HybF